ncbi:hypothetical protein Y032_0048g1702 [Ancylostoma ceylanicum]|uniref:Secreted protein n=1 Tax=Ancylostoma ceylanicum TaxID=53326 RepID=A0A016UBE7_9BILA|nr:hypothetical protein Y032_0048g1702 [Ancylostoma ceylanicum]
MFSRTFVIVLVACIFASQACPRTTRRNPAATPAATPAAPPAAAPAGGGGGAAVPPGGVLGNSCFLSLLERICLERVSTVNCFLFSSVIHRYSYGKKIIVSGYLYPHLWKVHGGMACLWSTLSSLIEFTYISPFYRTAN